MSEKFEAKLGLNTKEFDSKLKGTKTGMQKFGSAIKSVGKLMAGAFAVTAIVNFTRSLVTLAAKVEGIRIGFEQIAKPGLLDDLRAATKGTVSDMDLMSRAVMASNFQIPLEQLASLLSFASARAVQTGQSVDYLVNSIVLGIGRKSPLILDNLGISAIRLREVLKGAGVEMTTVGDVAEAIGKIGAEELAKMGGVAETAGTKIQSMAASMQNLKTNWGAFITQSKLFTGIVDIMSGALEIASTKQITFWQKALLGMGLYEQYAKSIAKTIKDEGIIYVPPAIIDPNYEAPQTLKTLNEELKTYQTLLEAANIEDRENIKNLVDKIKYTKDYIDLLSSGKALTPGSVKAPGKAGVNPLTGLFDKDAIKDYKKELNTLASGPNYKPFYDFTKGISEQQQALIDLSSTFAGFFSDVNLGFEGMIDGVITGIKRLVMELIAKAAFLAILSAIFPGAGVALNLGTILGGNASKLIGSGGGGSSKSASIGSASNQMTNSLVASLRGKDIQIALNRS